MLVAIAAAGTLAGCASGLCDSCPTASLTANGQSDLEVDVGTEIAYAWTSTNADLARSTVAIDSGADACGNTDGPWVISTLEGMRPPEPILPCQAGTSYTLELEVVQTATEASETAALFIRVR